MILNNMHFECATRKDEIYMHQQTDDIIVVTRQLDFSKSWDSYIVITRFCYEQKDIKCNEVIQLPGTIHEILFAAYIIDDLP